MIWVGLSGTLEWSNLIFCDAFLAISFTWDSSLPVGFHQGDRFLSIPEIDRSSASTILENSNHDLRGAAALAFFGAV